MQSACSTLLAPIGYQSSSCGYCKQDQSSAAYYLRARTLSPEHYQTLLDRGWRRSGNLLYLPDNWRSCCPHRTIRLPAVDFRPSRDHRQALHRWNRFVLGEGYLQQSRLKFPQSKQEKKAAKDSFDLCTTVHAAESSNLKPGIDPQHTFSVALEPDTFTEEKFLLFDHYQRHVHHEGDDDISKAGFKRFLCSSPLTRRQEGNGRQLGSYHQCYRLDGRLVAMAVLDLLPQAVSAVYFMYHTDFEKWSFGKLSALRETALALEHGHQFYYMGYYIHSCKKMRYKGDYKPQYVLNLENFNWTPLDDEPYAAPDKQRSTSPPRSNDDVGNAGDGKDDANVMDRSSTDEVMFSGQPLKAMKSRLSLLKLSMPGVLQLSELREQLDLNQMRVRLKSGGIHEMRYIQSWDAGSDLDTKSLKGIFAELAAAVGAELALKTVVDFS